MADFRPDDCVVSGGHDCDEVKRVDGVRIPGLASYMFMHTPVRLQSHRFAGITATKREGGQGLVQGAVAIVSRKETELTDGDGCKVMGGRGFQVASTYLVWRGRMTDIHVTVILQRTIWGRVAYRYHETWRSDDLPPMSWGPNRRPRAPHNALVIGEPASRFGTWTRDPARTGGSMDDT